MAINKSIKWLQINQNKTENCWSGPYGVSVYETSTAIYCLCLLDYADSQEVKSAVKFLLKWQNKFDGGWVAKRWDKDCETGATSFAIVALSEYLKRTKNNEIYLFSIDATMFLGDGLKPFVDALLAHPRFDAAMFFEDKSNKCISGKLREVFENEGFLLSEKAHVIKENDEWKIKDEERGYTYNIKKDEEYGRLKIYGKINESIKKGIEWLIRNKNEEKANCYWSAPDKNNLYWNISKTCDAIHALNKCGLYEYLFSWEDVPGKDSKQLLKFLKDNLKIEWVEDAKIEKSGDHETITITKNENLLIFKINKKEGKVQLETCDGRTYKYILKNENDKLNIYKEGDNETVRTMIKGGINWLLSKMEYSKKGDIIGVGWHDLVNTALVVEILVKVANIQSVPLRPNVEWLIKQQKEDGSWETETPRIILSLNSYLSKLEEDPFFEYRFY